MYHSPINNSTFVGNLGRDPELRYTPKGTAIVSISLAVTESRKNDSGEYEDNTTWVRLTAWDKMGERIAKLLKKGDKVLFNAKYSNRKGKDQEGKDTLFHDFTVTGFERLSKGKGGASADSDGDSGDEYGDDIPF